MQGTGLAADAPPGPGPEWVPAIKDATSAGLNHPGHLYTTIAIRSGYWRGGEIAEQLRLPRCAGPYPCTRGNRQRVHSRRMYERAPIVQRLRRSHRIEMIGVRMGDEDVGVAHGVTDGNQRILQRGSPGIGIDQRVDEQRRPRQLQPDAGPGKPLDAQALRADCGEYASARKCGHGRQACTAGEKLPAPDAATGCAVVVAHALRPRDAIAVSSAKPACAAMTSRLRWCHSRSKEIGRAHV